MPARRPSRRRLLLTSAALGLAAPLTAQAAEPVPKTEVASNETVTVTATRTAKDVNDVPATVSVITDEDIADALAGDIKDLIRFEPGVSVRAQPSRFSAALSPTGRDGNSGFNIRGIEGNRVLIQVDGVRIADGYGFGPQAVGRGDFVDLDLLKTVEIVRGPASALYGSDGLAGSVSFMTKDPVDFLKGDKDWHVQARAGYGSADDSTAVGFTLAARADLWSAMVSYTRRNTHELENQGTNEALNASRTAPNPEDGESNAVLAKLVWANDRHRVRLTLDHLDARTDWDVISARTIPPAPPGVLGATAVLGLAAFDDVNRDRVTLDHSFDGEGFIRSAETNVYFQDSTTRQFSFEDRNTAADRIRDATFDNQVFGFGSVLESAFDTVAVSHRLLYGIDYSLTRQDSIRTGTVPPAGETFPTRPFPETDYTLLGLFVQDEIALFDGALTLYPALRFDYYDLDPEENDPLYPSVAADSSDSHWSPKLGVVWKIDDAFSAFVNLAAGFKAPAPSQVNNFFSNLALGYSSIPNPDLHPETSESVEGGLRYRSGGFSASLVGFYGTYDDFISQQVVGGTGAPGNPLIFQFVNIGSVEISGIEARVQADLGQGFGAIAAVSYSAGDDTTGAVDVPLSTIDPMKVSAGLTYADEGDRFGGQLALVHSQGKEAGDTACANNPPATPCTAFLPGSFTVVDLTAWVRLGDNAKLRAGVFNITDETYWWWSDVRGLSATSTTLDAYTQPGRNYAVSLTVDF